jgi:hypothetical protein
MAEWRKVAKAAILADNRIDTREVNILRNSLLADGKVNQSELDFIQELRRECKSVVKAFTELYLEVVKKFMLDDNKEIGVNQTKWLKKAIIQGSDGKLDQVEQQLLQELQAEAKSTCPEFEKLYQEHIKK